MSPELKDILKRLTGNLLWFFLNQCLSQLLAFLGTVYLARRLGTEGFGMYALAMAIAQCLWILADFGITLYGNRLVAVDKEAGHHLFPLLTTIRVLAATTVFLGYLGALILLPLDPAYFLVLVGGGIFVLANSLNPEWLLKGMERIEFVVLGNLLIALTFLVSVLILVKTPDEVPAAVLLRSLANLPGALIMIFMVRRALRIRLRFSLAGVSKRLLKDAATYALNGGLGILYVYVFILVLGMLRSEAELGLFSSAHRLLLLIVMFGGVVPLAFFPVMADAHHNRRERFRDVHSLFQLILLALGMPIAVGGVLLAEDIILLVFGDAYREAVPFFKLLVGAVPLMFLRYSYGQSLLACGFQKPYLFASAIGTAFAVVVCPLLITWHGAAGAAIAFCLAEVVLAGMMFGCFSKKFFPAFPGPDVLWRVLLANAVMAAAVYPLQAHVAVRLLAGIVTYATALWLSGILSTVARRGTETLEG